MTGGQLRIVSAYKPQQITMSGGDEFARSLDSGEVADSVLADLASRARSASVDVKIHGKSGAPADAICELATEVGADLIIEAAV
jgi:nucleotide-binding universal stress UspA family protein